MSCWVGLLQAGFRGLEENSSFSCCFFLVPPVVVSPQGEWEQPPDQGSTAMSSHPEFLLLLSAVPGLGAREVPGTEMEPGFISRTWM